MVVLPENDSVRLIVNHLIEIAKLSTCKRSKCGSVIVVDDSFIIGHGYNSMPCNVTGECFKDTLAPTFKSDKTCCVHAEQRAIMDALKGKWNNRLKGSTLFFIRLDHEDRPMRSGQPYCSICSKMALDVGIENFVLWHEQGWCSYNTKEYNEATFQFR